MKDHCSSAGSVLLCTLLVFGNATTWAASGNALPRPSSEALAMTDANVALASGPAAQITNPANLIEPANSGPAWQAGAFFVDVSTRFSRAAPASGAAAGNFKAEPERVIVPFAATVHALSDRLVLGFALDVPFGLGVHWKDRTWDLNLGGPATADLAQTGELSVIRVGPTLAWRLRDDWSIGARLFGQFVDATDKNDISTLNADGESVGMLIGARWISDQIIFGAAYTTRTRTEIEGRLSDVHPAASSVLTPGSARADILLPDRLQLGAAARWRQDLWWEFDVDWFGWSYVDELTVVEADGSIANAGKNARHNKDTLSVQTGIKWHYAPRLTLYAGLGYEPSPVPQRDASPITTVTRKTRLGLGGAWRLQNEMRVDFAYQFARGHRRRIGASDQDSFGALGDTRVFEGRYESDSHFLGVTVSGGF